jgi:hypothetical protein
VSAATACVRHPAGHAIIEYLFIYFSISFSACSTSMREASCGSMLPAIVLYYSLIYS